MRLSNLPRLIGLLAFTAYTQAALPDGIVPVQTLGNIEEYRLSSNDLSVLLLPIDGLPVATVMVTYTVGSRNEVTGTTGATHILEHMMFKGTEQFNSADGSDYSSQMERIGAIANATTWFDRTNYYATLPSQYVPMALELEADRLRNLLIREDDLASEMTVVRNEYERAENSPVSTLIKELFATAYMAHPYNHPTIGWESDIENITVEKLRDFYDTYYWPENAVVTIVGGFDRTATLKAIATHYGNIPKAPHSLPEMTTREPEQTGPRRVTVQRAGQTGVVMIGFKVAEGLHQDWAALTLLQQILGANRTGRLYRALEDQGLANATFTFAPQLRDPGLFIFGAYLTPDASHQAVEAIILEEVGSLTSSGVGQDELARAKSVIAANNFYGRDGPYQIADQINEAIAMGDWSAYVNLPEAIQDVSAETLKKVASRYFVERGRTTGWFVPERTNQRSLSAPVLPGPQYYRDPELHGPLRKTNAELPPGNTTVQNGANAVDFASRMQRAQVGPIELVTIRMPIEGVVSFIGSLAAGDSLSPPDAPMLAGLTASMLDKGTTGADRFQIAERLETLGASVDFAADAQSLRFSGKFLRADVGPVMNLLADQLRNPTFDPEVFETIQRRQQASLLQAIDNPDYRASARLSRHLYPETHLNHKPALETLIADLERTAAQDLADFHATHYGPESLRLVFVGDIDFEQVKAAVGNAFDGWKGGSQYPELQTEQTDHGQHSERIYIEDKTSVSVRLGHNTRLQRTDQDYLPFMLGNFILGGSFHSRLMSEVRESRGLTYDIRSRHEGDILTPGNWLLTASFSPGQLDEGLRVTREVLNRWHDEGVSEEEVAAAIETLTGSYLVGLSTTAHVAGQVHSFMERGFPPEYIDAYPLDIRQLTAESVNRAIRQYFDPTQLVEVAAGTFGEAAPDPADHGKRQTIQLRIDAPDAGWSLAIMEVYRTQERILAVSRLHRSEDLSAQVISTVSDAVDIDATQADLPIRHFVIGKTWDWGNSDAFTPIESSDELHELLKNAEVLYRRDE
ncbi:MAG: insulinase family protein [Puniceicoccaceae bacterium]|nr:MAG: insulinase family protein [Puniceicoccaceae bacterium]